jgi:hypothetical protein
MDLNCVVDLNIEGAEICKWMLKVPQTTNQRYYSCSNIHEILQKLCKYSRQYYGVIQYVILQRCLINRLEKKVVCLNMEPQYIASIGNSDKAAANRTTVTVKHDDLYDLARQVLSIFKERCPDFLCSGLTRVDFLHCDILKKWFVNEVESLEANFSSNLTLDTGRVKTFLIDYYRSQVIQFVEEVDAFDLNMY